MVDNKIVKGTLTFFIAILVVMVSVSVIYREGLANYRAKALCLSIQSNGRVPDNDAPSSEKSNVDDAKTVMYVRKGVFGFSQYTCTVKLQKGKVIETLLGHQWSF